MVFGEAVEGDITLFGRNIGCDKDNIDDAMVKILFWGLPKPSLPLFNSFLLVNLVR